MATDFGRTASDYARHRAGFPDAFFERVFADGSVRKGDVVLDLGTGTGTVARGLALRGCEVTGLDHSAPLLVQAAEMDRAAGVQVKQVRAWVENADFPPSRSMRSPPASAGTGSTARARLPWRVAGCGRVAAC